MKPHPAETPLPRLDGVEHRFVDLPGLRMHVAEAGHGDPVLLLHGFPQHWWEWRKVIPDLAEHHRLVVPDLRGAGWTEAPRVGYTRDQLLADVVALLDALGLEQVDLLTHDYGSLVGYHRCLRHPERVGRHLSLSIPRRTSASTSTWWQPSPGRAGSTSCFRSRYWVLGGCGASSGRSSA